MKISIGGDKYYGHNGGWLCQTPAIAVGKGENFINGEKFITLTLYILFWSFTIQFELK
jgi:hypothetical protein